MEEFLLDDGDQERPVENPYADEAEPALEQERRFPHPGSLLFMPIERPNLVGPTMDTSRPAESLLPEDADSIASAE
jgi:hypothetical protein